MAYEYINQSHLTVNLWQQPGTTAARFCQHALRLRPLRCALRPLRPQLWIAYQLIGPVDIQFWSDFFSTEIPSSECLWKVRSLLTCPTKITAARSFRGNQAQIIIDFLDRVSN